MKTWHHVSVLSLYSWTLGKINVGDWELFYLSTLGFSLPGIYWLTSRTGKNFWSCFITLIVFGDFWPLFLLQRKYACNVQCCYLTMRLKAHFFLIFLFAAGVRVWRGADDVCWLCLTQRDRMQLTKWIPPLRSRIKSLHSLLWGTGPELSEKTFLPILWDGLLRFGGFWLLTRSKVWQQQGTFSTKCH